VAALVGLATLLLIAVVTAVVARTRRREKKLARQLAQAAPPARPATTAVTQAAPATQAGAAAPGSFDLGDWGPARGRGEALGASAAPTEPASPQAPEMAPAQPPDLEWPIDRVLPRHVAGTFVLALAIGLAVWLAGLALAPRAADFLASREWQFQPFYLAGHIIAVRLFVLAYTRGFERGVAHLAVPEDRIATLVTRVLGAPGVLIALLIALPFAFFDFLYLFSDRYQRLGGPSAVLPIDYLMWGIWSVEWLVNAYIWVIVVGFLAKTSWLVRRHPFRAPIEIVLHDKHYKPLLQMNAQGSSVVLLFTILTVGYISYTGGELTDYVGLGITALMIVVGFVPSWLLLRSKVQRAVEEETLAMRRQLVHNLEMAGIVSQTRAPAAAPAAAIAPPGSEIAALARRLDAAVAILRISYLEGRHQSMGQTEARAVMIRLLAPAASIGWQVAKPYAAKLSELQAMLPRLF